MTHRVFSRNASSSRAIPVERMIEEVKNDPYIPASWGANRPGMQADEEIDAITRATAREIYLDQLYTTLANARDLARLNPAPHKQIINRLLEPFAHITVLVTSTRWANWFALRDHGDAEPNIAELARNMRTVWNESIPTEIPHGGWHLPFIDPTSGDVEHAAAFLLAHSPTLGDNPDLLEHEIFWILAKLSAARCARVSYNNHDGTTPKLLKDLELFEKLMGGNPLHASPAEHQAQPDRKFGPAWEHPELHGNFHGWKQFRKNFYNEAGPAEPDVKRLLRAEQK